MAVQPRSFFSRNWVFTRQLTPEEIIMVPFNALNFEWHKDPRVVYLIYQLEKAPTTGQLHVQGLVHFKSTQRMSAVKKLIGHDPHCEICRDFEASVAYCSKEKTREKGPWEFGIKPKQGKRSDLEELYSDIKAGKTTAEIFEANPCVAKFDRQVKLFRALQLEKKSDRQAVGVKVIVYYGDPGTGKTFAAINQDCNNFDYFKVMAPSTKGQKIWFDGYEGQANLIIDDFDGQFCGLGFLNNLLDKYKMAIEYKGGMTWACWTQVIITSNYVPREWFQSQLQEHPLVRRLHYIYHNYKLNGEIMRTRETFDGIELPDETLNLTEGGTWINRKIPQDDPVVDEPATPATIVIPDTPPNSPI